MHVAPDPGPAAGKRLAESHVVVIGAGSLGSTVISALAAAGVGTLVVVDDDAAALANANASVRSASGATIVRHPLRFAAGATFDLLLEADVLVDSSNDVATRYLANDAAAVRGIPLVWGSAGDQTGHVGVAWDERGVDYRDLVPDEPSAVAAPHELAAPPAVYPVTGAMMSSEVIKLVTGVGEPLIGRVAVYDASTGATHEISYRRDPAVARPGSLEERTALREPDPERSITAEQLAKLLAGPETAGIHETPPVLLDVRERPEASFASLPGSVLIPLGELPDRLGELDPEASVVVYCHHGVRSARALDVLEKNGFRRARHLTGGLDAWSVAVDPAVPRY